MTTNLWTVEEKQAEISRSWKLMGLSVLVLVIAWPLNALLGQVAASWTTLTVLAIAGALALFLFGIVRLVYSLTHQTSGD